MPNPTLPDPLAPHWAALSLQPAAPACVIKEAHRFHIRLAHPDVGGSDEAAMRVNVAMDKLGSKGTPANEHVARYVTSGEPWHVLGLLPSADQKLVERVGKALCAELEALPRLSTRVEWAVRNFGAPAQPPPPRPRVRQAPPPQPKARPKGFWTPPAPRAPVAGRPDGVPLSIDFGEFSPGSEAEHVMRLTWPGLAPPDIRIETNAPIAWEITRSNTNRGRVAVRLTIDWDAPAFAPDAPPLKSFDARLTIRWGEDDTATVRVTGTPLQPLRVGVGPKELDFGTTRLRERATAELTLRSSRATSVEIESSAWLNVVDGSGRRMSGRIRVDGSAAPTILTLAVDWKPIIERGAASIEAKRPLKPSGRVCVRWDGGEITVPATMLVETK